MDNFDLFQVLRDWALPYAQDIVPNIDIVLGNQNAPLGGNGVNENYLVIQLGDWDTIGQDSITQLAGGVQEVRTDAEQKIVWYEVGASNGSCLRRLHSALLTQDTRDNFGAFGVGIMRTGAMNNIPYIDSRLWKAQTRWEWTVSLSTITQFAQPATANATLVNNIQ